MRARIRGRVAKPHKLTDMQRLLVAQLEPHCRRDADMLGWEVRTEHQFHPTRKWRVDVCLMNHYRHMPIAIEIDGGAWTGGRHTSGAGFIKDLEKMNALTECGWRVLRFTPQQVRTGEALAQIERCL